MSKEVAEETTTTAPKRGKNIFKIPFEDLRIEEGFNQRIIYDGIEELAAQIKESGQKTPLVVSRIRGTDTYYVRSGHRRYRAFKLLVKQGVDVGYVQAELEENGITEEQRIIDMMLYNEGKPFTMLEQGICFASLKRLNYDVGDIQRKLGIKNPKTVYDGLLLANAPKEVQDSIVNGRISDSVVVKIIAENKKDWPAVQEIIKEATQKAGDNTKATAKHVTGLKDKTPIQKLVEMVEKADARPDDFDMEKVELIRKLAEKLKSKTKVPQLLALLK